MAEHIVINGDLAIPLTEIMYSASRSSGPGGQHVNKTESRIQLRWNLRLSTALDERQRARLATALASRLTGAGELILACEDHRSQHRNREAVTERLVAIVRQALIEPKRRKPTQPTRAARERRRRQKRKRADIKRQRRTPAEDD